MNKRLRFLLPIRTFIARVMVNWPGSTITFTPFIPFAALAVLSFLLALLFLVPPPAPALATEPTPTPEAAVEIGPAAQPPEPACSLANSAGCDFIDPTTGQPFKTGTEPSYRLHPLVGASDVPTHTLISVSFAQSLDASTINATTFYLSQSGFEALAGKVEYIEAGKIAIFYPATPLQAGTTYTATLTRGARDLSGLPLIQDLVWTFTTSSGGSLLGQAEFGAAGTGLPGGGMNIYFGDLHSHSLLSDGWGSPATAYATARARGLDFFALSDHCFMLTPTEWQQMRAEANAATNAYFVGLPGFEYTHLKGHINVFGTDSYVHRDDPNYDTLKEFYAWLVSQPTAIGQFNHPLENQWHDWNFDNFAYSPAADQKMVLQELSSASQFFLSLNKGWHLGSVGNSDAHQANWGERRMGLVAPALTREAILEALRARRTFFASPNHPGFALVMQANGRWMGSAIPNTGSINLTIYGYDPSPSGQSLRLKLYDNGQLIATTSRSSSKWYTWAPTVPAILGHYYYVEAYYGSWLYPAYTSPIWVERPPLARVGPPQYVAPGASVTLTDQGSYDPDGDVLAYQWSQLSGSTVSLSGANQPKATFVAPNTLGNLVFNLSVVDPGGQSDSETVSITVTDQPILSITKTGPATVQADELIIYLLTVTNRGISPAANVVVTDTVPSGATYISGGTLAGNIVSWTIDELAPNGGSAQVSFAVTAAGTVVNKVYGASCSGCIPVKGQANVVTNPYKVYLPLIRRGK